MNFHGKEVVFDGVENHPETKDVQDIFSKIVSEDSSIGKYEVLKFEYKSEPLGVYLTLVKVYQPLPIYFIEVNGEKLLFSTCSDMNALEYKVQKHFMDEFLKMVCREYLSVNDVVITNSEAQWCISRFKYFIRDKENKIV